MANFRNVYKSNHLGVVDLEEFIESKKSLIFTIKEVKQEIGAIVAGNKGDHNIAYFKEDIKPLVLNAGNANIVRGFAGSIDTDNWKNIPIELYVDHSVKMKGQIVGGIRIKPIQPKIVKTKPIFTEENFEKAKIAKADLDKVKEIYQTTPEIEAKYQTYYNGGAA
jgi:N-acetylglutamate synthase/N-acetylornithine aminotransferase